MMRSSRGVWENAQSASPRFCASFSLVRVIDETEISTSIPKDSNALKRLIVILRFPDVANPSVSKTSAISTNNPAAPCLHRNGDRGSFILIPVSPRHRSLALQLNWIPPDAVCSAAEASATHKRLVEAFRSTASSRSGY